MTTTAINLKPGDLYPNPIDDSRPMCHVDRVELVTKVIEGETRVLKKWMTDVPMVRVFLTDGPKVIKCVEVPGDREVPQA